jgi:peroxiredoxin
MSTPSVPLNQGIHVVHLFYRIDRERWARLPEGAASSALAQLTAVCAANPGPAHPRVLTYANVGGKADIAVVLFAAELQQASALQRAVERAFPPGTLQPVYSYLSVTELPEYVATEEDLRRMISHGERAVEPGTPGFDAALEAARVKNREYQHYRLYPELPDWPILCFYPMSKKRDGGDNWYSLEFEVRKKLMGSHAKTGRKFAGRISQLITGSAGLDDFEWGVTLMAQKLDDVKSIVYEMRFDEVTARYGVFGPFYINLRLPPAELWEHLGLNQTH